MKETPDLAPTLGSHTDILQLYVPSWLATALQAPEDTDPAPRRCFSVASAPQPGLPPHGKVELLQLRTVLTAQKSIWLIQVRLPGACSAAGLDGGSEDEKLGGNITLHFSFFLP